MASTNLDIIIHYNNQKETFMMFIQHLLKIYHSNIDLHAIIHKNDVNLYSELDAMMIIMSININIFHSIHEAVDNIDNDYFFYQDVTVQHPYNLLTFVEKHMDKEYDFIGINKETIRYNVLPDILYCKKESYISKHMKFELQILYTYYYKIVG